MSVPFDKVVVIGLDGLEPVLVEEGLRAGALPHFARLVEQGGLARLATTTPAQTPVAWSSFATGTNPGGHGIFDFLRRDPRTYLPDNALCRHERRHPWSPPRAVNLRGGEPVWSVLGEAGAPSVVLRCPCTYPPGPTRGRLLSGMGVPDLRGGFGTSTYYTTDDGVTAGESERVIVVRPETDGTVRTHLVGPRHPRGGTDARLNLTLKPDPTSGRCFLECDDATPTELVLSPGAWSDWLRVRFKLGPFQTVHGMTRFFLARSGPERIALLASPINFDPAAPLFPISEPAQFANELAQGIGLFDTTGMVENHGGLNNGRLDEAAFLDQCEGAWKDREAMLLHELGRFDRGLLFCLFDTPDRIQHMFWRYREPDHPSRRSCPPSEDLRHVLEDAYRRADAVVGRVMQAIDDRTLLIVMSDHGFGSFQRGVDLNCWLWEQGLLALRDGKRPEAGAPDMLRGIDWSRTRAYALGLGGIHVNLRGREGEGTVAPEEAEALKASIAEALPKLVDPARGVAAVRRAESREALYHGPHVAEAPDLVVCFNNGYRVSWATAIGGIGASTLEDNTKAWSGDHIIAPELVPGVLLMNRPFRTDAPRIIDVAPTILGALGVPAGRLMEGRSLR